LDFPTRIVDEKFDAVIRGGYHVGLATILFFATFSSFVIFEKLFDFSTKNLTMAFFIT
jgi:hypothetical protein